MNLGTWLERYSQDCRLKYPSDATRKTYYSCVAIFLDYFQKYSQPKEIPTQEIKRWLLLSESFATRNSRLCAVKSFYEITVGMPLKLEKIPFAKKEKKLPRLINIEETVRKIQAIENIKHRAILSVGLCCGLRVSEAVNIQIADVNGRDRVILIRLAKGKKDRFVPVSENVLTRLQQYFREYKPTAFLFEGQKGGQYSTIL